MLLAVLREMLCGEPAAAEAVQYLYDSFITN